MCIFSENVAIQGESESQRKGNRVEQSCIRPASLLYLLVFQEANGERSMSYMLPSQHLLYLSYESDSFLYDIRGFLKANSEGNMVTIHYLCQAILS